MSTLLQRPRGFRGEFVRYCLVGVVAALLDYATLVGLVRGCGVHYQLAAVAGFGIGLATNYILSIAWAFRRRAVQDRRVEFALFAIVGVVGLLLTQAILYLGTDLARLPVEITKPAAIAIVFLWNFGARKAALFSTSRRQAPNAAVAAELAGNTSPA